MADKDRFTVVSDFQEDEEWKPRWTIRTPEDNSQADRVTVRVSGIVIDMIANEDETVYVEVYAYERAHQAVIQSAFIDAYKHTSPSFRIALADKPKR